MSSFCVKCGTEENLVNEFCRNCFSKENSTLRHFKDLNIVICNSCGSYLFKNAWKVKFEEDFERNVKKVVGEIFKRKIVLNTGARLDEIITDVELPKKLKVGAGNSVNIVLKVSVRGFLEDVELEEDFEIPVKIKFAICNNCKKLKGRYFEATLQIRPKSEEILAYAENYCDGRKNLFISKVEEDKHGYDVFLSDQREARTLGRTLKKKFGGEIKETKKLFGRKDGQDVYRGTVLFRLK